MNIDEHILNFKNSILKSYKQNDEYLIYLRLSAIDKKATDPIKDTMNKLKGDFNSLINKYPILKEKGFTIFIEVKSAYKDSIREEFVNMYENYIFKDLTIQNILENTNTQQNKKSLYIASYDRLSRVFLYSLLFQLMRKIVGVEIYTLMDSENAIEETSQDIHNSSSNEQLMYVFQLMMFSSMSMKHSEDLSNKISKRVDVKDGVTISNKTGKKWGLSKSIPEEVIKRIIEYKQQGLEYRFISMQEDIYKINSKTKKKEPISIPAIKKAWLEYKNNN